jgi:hypothetical protein
MNKKFLIAGMAAVLGVSLSFFACDSAADGSTGGEGDPGPAGPFTVQSGWTLESVQDLVEIANDTGSEIFFVDATLSGGPGFLDLRGGQGDLHRYPEYVCWRRNHHQRGECQCQVLSGREDQGSGRRRFHRGER